MELFGLWTDGEDLLHSFMSKLISPLASLCLDVSGAHFPAGVSDSVSETSASRDVAGRLDLDFYFTPSTLALAALADSLWFIFVIQLITF